MDMMVVVCVIIHITDKCVMEMMMVVVYDYNIFNGNTN